MYGKAVQFMMAVIGVIFAITVCGTEKNVMANPPIMLFGLMKQ